MGHAMYARTGDDRAEVALTIADEYQGQGLGTILLGHLAEAATEHGIGVFETLRGIAELVLKRLASPAEAGSR